MLFHILHVLFVRAMFHMHTKRPEVYVISNTTVPQTIYTVRCLLSMDFRADLCYDDYLPSHKVHPFQSRMEGMQIESRRDVCNPRSTLIKQLHITTLSPPIKMIV